MKNYFWKYLIYLLTFLALQFLIFNNMVIKVGNWYFVPYVYILFFLLLPIETDRYTMLGLAVLIGLTMDFLEGSLALHTAALIAVAYFRGVILQSVAPQLGYNQGMLLSYLNYGMGWFIKYASVFTIAHHFIYFLLNNFSLLNIINIVLQTIINSFLTVIFLIVLHYFFKNRPINV